jgi:cytochrome c oxidase assembly factor 3
MSPGLQRAREPYRVKNAMLGLLLGAFAVGVWAYSINAVKQDVFDDVDEEVAALSADTKGKTTVALTAEGPAVTPTSATVSSKPVQEYIFPVQTPESNSAKGILPSLEKRIPLWFKLLDPERKTLVWGATPIDNMGKMGDNSVHD